MRSGLQTKNILTILILLCFSIYAVSPLARTFQLNSANTVRGVIERPAAKIYIIHFLLSGLLEDASDDVTAEQEDTSDGHILIKKKKALLSAKNLRSILSLSTVETVARDSERPEATLSVRLDISSAKPHTVQYLLASLHSGNAPPAV